MRKARKAVLVGLIVGFVFGGILGYLIVDVEYREVLINVNTSLDREYHARKVLEDYVFNLENFILGQRMIIDSTDTVTTSPDTAVTQTSPMR